MRDDERDGEREAGPERDGGVDVAPAQATGAGEDPGQHPGRESGRDVGTPAGQAAGRDAGADPGPDPGADPVDGSDPDDVRVDVPDVGLSGPALDLPARRAGAGTHGVLLLDRPSRSDPVVRAATEVIGGPAGRRMVVGARRFGPGGGLLWITTVLCLLAGVTLAFGLVTKAHCRNAGWNTPDQFWHECYSDIPVLYGSAGLGRHDPPTLVDAVRTGPGGLGQPPLASVAMWVVSRAIGGGEGAGPARLYFDVSAVLMAAALAVAVAAVAAAADRRPWDAAQVALAPILVTGGLISYDLMAVALLACGLLAWSRYRPVLGGVFLGAAIATRPVTAVVLLAVLVLAVRTGRTRPFVALALPAGLVWFGIRLVLVGGGNGGLGDALTAWRRSGAGYGSLWLIPHLVAQSQPDRLRVWSVLRPIWYKGGGLGPATTTMCVVIALALVALATVFVGLAVADRPRLAHLALFAVAGSVLVTKSVPVQAGLVLLPLIALAGLRWRDTLIWATTELVYFVGVWLYIGASSDPNKGLPATVYLLMVLARAGGYAWLMAQAVRAMRDPVLDPVRVPADGSPGTDDPQGGEFEGSPDALVVRLV